MKNFKKAIGFLVLLFLVITVIPSVSYAADGQQYTENLIPKMTANTVPSGHATCTSYLLMNGPSLAFDKDVSTSWLYRPSGGYLAYEFTEAKRITKYTISSQKPVYKSIKELPRDWTFEAWDEISNTWVVLDTQKNIYDWSVGVKKEFAIINNKSYKNYRINVTSNGGDLNYLAIGELEMMETVTTIITAPTNLVATAGDTIVNLKWDTVEGATSYNIKRSEASGGPYTTISSVTGSAISYTDKDVINGKTYYYVITAVTTSGESANSNEVSATPTSTSSPVGNRAILVISFNNGQEKEYDLSAAEIDKFVNWYDGRSEGSGKSYFTIQKYSNVKPFISRKEYIKFDNIESFEIKDYNE